MEKETNTRNVNVMNGLVVQIDQCHLVVQANLFTFFFLYMYISLQQAHGPSAGGQLNPLQG